MLELVFEWSVKRINGQAVGLQNELKTVKSTIQNVTNFFRDNSEYEEVISVYYHQEIFVTQFFFVT